MVKVKCGSCGQTLGVPEKFAGKRILCPQCKAAVSVPQATESGGTSRQNLIKFHCPKCSQKIGLPLEYAGKQVRCAKCKTPLRVPGGSPPKQPPLVPQHASPPPQDDFDPLADLPDLNDQDEAPLQLRPLGDPPTTSESNDMARNISTANMTSGLSDSSAGSSGLQIDNNLIALLASFIFVIIGGMAWGLIAKYAHMELGLLAWVIGVLAGLGVYWFTTSRGALLGIALAFIALFGILCGKYFIAKWYYMPQFKAEMNKRGGISGFFDPNSFEMSDENVRQITDNPGFMFGLVAMQLADDGKITKEDAEYYTTRKLDEAFGQKDNVKIDDDEQQKKELRKKDVEKMVYKCLSEWSDKKKANVVRTQYPKVMKKFADIFAKSPLMNVVGFAVAFVAAFSFFDLIWFPCAMVTAYKFGTGENS